MTSGTNQTKVNYDGKARLLYTDTDSILLETDDVYANMKSIAAQYDFSEYPRDHPNRSIGNKKVVDKFKDECCGGPITEFVGLRPRCTQSSRQAGAISRKPMEFKK